MPSQSHLRLPESRRTYCDSHRRCEEVGRAFVYFSGEHCRWRVVLPRIVGMKLTGPVAVPDFLLRTFLASLHSSPARNNFRISSSGFLHVAAFVFGNLR